MFDADWIILKSSVSNSLECLMVEHNLLPAKTGWKLGFSSFEFHGRYRDKQQALQILIDPLENKITATFSGFDLLDDGEKIIDKIVDKLNSLSGATGIEKIKSTPAVRRYIWVVIEE